MKHIDIGLNLFCPQFPDPEKIYEEAKEAGVAAILTGSDPEDNEKAAAFAQSHEDVWSTAGIHPHNADRVREEDFLRIAELVKGEKNVAVGECGLDYDRMFAKKENQLYCLQRHIAIAQESGKPLFLHCRDAFTDFIEIFSAYPELCQRSVVHCYTGDRETAEKLLEMGFSFGITGWICDERRGDELREAVKIIPAERLLIETDAPYLTPRGIKGLSRTNHPRNIIYVLQRLAQEKGMEEEGLRQQLLQNTIRIFGLKKES